jgi:hypothetical protein
MWEITPISGVMVGVEYQHDANDYKYLVIDFFLVRFTFHYDASE